MTAGGGGAAAYAGQMAPPPPKMRMQNQPQGYHSHQYREMSDENVETHGVRVQGSDTAWSTEMEESY